MGSNEPRLCPCGRTLHPNERDYCDLCIEWGRIPPNEPTFMSPIQCICGCKTPKVQTPKNWPNNWHIVVCPSCRREGDDPRLMAGDAINDWAHGIRQALTELMLLGAKSIGSLRKKLHDCADKLERAECKLMRIDAQALNDAQIAFATEFPIQMYCVTEDRAFWYDEKGESKNGSRSGIQTFAEQMPNSRWVMIYKAMKKYLQLFPTDTTSPWDTKADTTSPN